MLPECRGGERACPPEGCGGVPGYQRILAIVADPEHDEYEETMVWLMGGYAPERFDPRQVRFDDSDRRWAIAFSE